MEKYEENQPVEPMYGIPFVQDGTVVPYHEGEDGMGARSMTVGRYEEIRRRLAEGRGVREIARALNCSRFQPSDNRWRRKFQPVVSAPAADALQLGV